MIVFSKIEMSSLQVAAMIANLITALLLALATECARWISTFADLKNIEVMMAM